jgi:putative aldouronate transport system substrate-binding protein
MKRSILKMFLLILALNLIAVTAVWSAGNAEDGGTQTQSLEDADPFGKYDPPITVTTVDELPEEGAAYSEGFDEENNNWFNLYREELGVDVEYEWRVDKSQFLNRRNIAIASGDIPDIMQITFIQFYQMQRADMLADLTEVYEAYATDLTKEVMEADELNLSSVTMNEKLLGIPVGGDYLESTPLLWIRKDWLNAVNMEPPKTIDDMIEVARAFTFEDPDGNGEDDTYGLTFAGRDHAMFRVGWGLSGFFDAFGAHVARGPNNGAPFFFNVDGKAVWAGETDGMKDALRTLNDMYEDGIFREDFGTMKGNNVVQDLVGGKVGMVYGYHWNPLWPYNQLMQKHLEDGKDPVDWIPVQPPARTASEPTKIPYNNPSSNVYVVRKEYEHPEVLIKFLNLWIEMNYGDMNTPENRKTYLSAEEAKSETTAYHSVVDGIFRPFKNLKEIWEPIMKVQNGEMKVSELSTEAKTYYDIAQDWPGEEDDPIDERVNAWSHYRWLGLDGVGPWNTISVMFENDQYIPNAFLGTVGLQTLQNYDTVAKGALMEVVQRIIYGAEDLSAWDEFLVEWNNTGGGEMKALAQAWIDQQENK